MGYCSHKYARSLRSQFLLSFPSTLGHQRLMWNSISKLHTNFKIYACVFSRLVTWTFISLVFRPTTWATNSISIVFYSTYCLQEICYQCNHEMLELIFSFQEKLFLQIKEGLKSRNMYWKFNSCTFSFFSSIGTPWHQSIVSNCASNNSARSDQMWCYCIKIIYCLKHNHEFRLSFWKRQWKQGEKNRLFMLRRIELS